MSPFRAVAHPSHPASSSIARAVSTPSTSPPASTSPSPPTPARPGISPPAIPRSAPAARTSGPREPTLDRRRMNALLSAAPSRRGTPLIREFLASQPLPLWQVRSWLEGILLHICSEHSLPLPAVNRLPRLRGRLLLAGGPLHRRADGGDHLDPTQRDRDNDRDFVFARPGPHPPRLLQGDGPGASGRRRGPPASASSAFPAGSGSGNPRRRGAPSGQAGMQMTQFLLSHRTSRRVRRCLRRLERHVEPSARGVGLGRLRPRQPQGLLAGGGRRSRRRARAAARIRRDSHRRHPGPEGAHSLDEHGRSSEQRPSARRRRASRTRSGDGSRRSSPRGTAARRSPGSSAPRPPARPPRAPGR